MSEENDTFINNLQYLRFVAPEFAVNGDNIEILQTPTEFHTKLVENARGAKKRIVLAALYLGTGHLEEELLEAVHEAARSSQGDMSITILIDYVRGSRGQKNSIDMLKPLLDLYAGSDKLKVCLYHTPNLRGILRKLLPRRWNETIGVAHLKAFIFDDNFIISGANLSHDYFINRQDRYMLFRNCPQLANYFTTLVDTIGDFSLTLSPNGSIQMPPGYSHHPYEGNLRDFIEDVNGRVKNMISSYLGTKVHNLFEECCKLPEKVDQSSKVFNSKSPSLLGKSQFSNVKFGSENMQTVISEANATTADTWVYPTIQMGLFEIRQDEFITKSLFKSFTSGSKVYFTTGYFNVTDEYCDVITHSDANYDILLSSPEANGFFGSSGFSKHIPQVYIHLCKTFFFKVKDAGRIRDFSFLEYIRSGWTFHGKGLWCYPPGEKLPNMTLIGSPNFGSRSVNRDLEAQLVLLTRNVRLKKKLHREKNDLVMYTKPISTETFKQSRYYVPRWVAFVTNFIKIYF